MGRVDAVCSTLRHGALCQDLLSPPHLERLETGNFQKEDLALLLKAQSLRASFFLQASDEASPTHTASVLILQSAVYARSSLRTN